MPWKRTKDLIAEIILAIWNNHRRWCFWYSFFLRWDNFQTLFDSFWKVYALIATSRKYSKVYFLKCESWENVDDDRFAMLLNAILDIFGQNRYVRMGCTIEREKKKRACTFPGREPVAESSSSPIAQFSTCACFIWIFISIRNIYKIERQIAG